MVERAIHPIALNRKNALFVSEDEDGRTWAPHRVSYRDLQAERR
jgi:hypothetical protein